MVRMPQQLIKLAIAKLGRGLTWPTDRYLIKKKEKRNRSCRPSLLYYTPLQHRAHCAITPYYRRPRPRKKHGPLQRYYHAAVPAAYEKKGKEVRVSVKASSSLVTTATT
jgi:hypothetical protein